MVRKTITCLALTFATLATVGFGSSECLADQQGGLLGFYAKPTGYGLSIHGFIENSSAQSLHRQGEIERGDVILAINDRPVRETRDIFFVTDQMRPGIDFAILKLRTRTGQIYQLEISPSEDSSSGAQPCFIKTTALSRNGSHDNSGYGGGTVVPRRRPRDF